MGKILIVDDEPDIVELVKINLEKNGFDVISSYTGREIFNLFKKFSIDLVILDLMLPDIDGLEICKILKSENETKNIPIIMLTAKDTEIDKVLGLELGADDYITKPFSPRELVARVRAVLRRTRKPSDESILKFDNILRIDLKKFEVFVNGKKINLTTTEFKLLKALAIRRGEVLSRNELLDYIWGSEKIVIDRTIDVHIKHLREKLGKVGKFIKNVRGVGYKLDL
ncbi:MAG: response regulator transcription factor [Caldisericia bacterium]|nr:response regulator transcription factor [Caldisericia bacterium]